MKRLTVRTMAALAAAGLLFTAAPAQATTAADPAARIVKPDPSDRIIPAPRPPRIPCRIITPPGWDVPLYCDRHPIQPPPRIPVDPIIPGPVIPGPVIPIETH